MDLFRDWGSGSFSFFSFFDHYNWSSGSARGKSWLCQWFLSVGEKANANLMLKKNNYSII